MRYQACFVAGLAAGWLLARFSGARARRKRLLSGVTTAPIAPEAITNHLRSLGANTNGLPLEGVTALITGAGNGVGRGAALALARLGASIVANDLPGSKTVDETASLVKALGRQCEVRKVDVTDADAVEAMASEFAGRLDVVVANAAWSDRSGPIHEQEYEMLRKTLEVSQMGVVHTVRSGVRALRATQEARRARASEGQLADSGDRSPRVVIISSIMGSQPLSQSAAAYSMAKAAITHLGKCVAAELCPHRINVNVVAPGWIDTPGERKWTSDEAMARLAPAMPWGRQGTIDDVGAAVAFLCSDAADYITGSCLVVDGGYSVSLRLPMGATA
jgi:glucose 1-dehydrogenase